MLGVVRAAVRADEEVLDEAQRKVDGLVRVDKVLEHDGWLGERREFEAVRVDGAEDPNALERAVAQQLVLGSVLDRRAEEDLDETPNARVERVARGEGLHLDRAGLEQRLELAQGLVRDDVVLARDAVEQVSEAVVERPVLTRAHEAAVGLRELLDLAQVGDVLHVPRQVVGIVDDEIVDRLGGRRSLGGRQLWPQADKGGRRRADEGANVAELERLEERAERIERDESQAGQVERSLQRRHDLHEDGPRSASSTSGQHGYERERAHLRREACDGPPDHFGNGVEAADDLLLVAQRTLVARLVQAAVHVRQEADNGVLEDVRRVEAVARRVPEAGALDGLECALGLRRHLDVLVAKLERELVHERDVDRLEEPREHDAAALAHEDLESLRAQLVGLHVQVREDRRRDGRVAQHLGDLDARRVCDLLQERALVAEDNAGEGVLARDAQQRLARLMEDLECCR